MSEDTITRRQMAAAAFVALLSPVARRFPGSLVMQAGNAAWLAVPVAALPALVMLLFMARLLRSGRSLGDAFELSLGRVAGRGLVLAVSLWLLFYCGFIFRSSAYRFTSTVYPATAGWIFVACSALCCLPIASGRFSAIARWAVLLRPLLLLVLAAVFAISLPEWRLRGVFRLEEADALPVLRCGLAVLNTLSVVCYLGFAEHHCDEPFRVRSFLPWLGVLLVISELLCLSCLGVFGPELTAKLSFPFFLLVRDVSLADSFARMEALIIALWIFADAVHVSLLLRIAAGNLGRVLGLRARACAPAVTAAACAVGLALPGDMLGVGRFSELIVPGGNALIIFGLLPLVAAVGWLRGKL